MIKNKNIYNEFSEFDHNDIKKIVSAAIIISRSQEDKYNEYYGIGDNFELDESVRRLLEIEQPHYDDDEIKKQKISDERSILLTTVEKYISPTMITKFHQEKKIPSIEYGAYEYTYVMSDIHADFRRFIMTMIKNKIIGLIDKKDTEIKDYETEIKRLVDDEYYIYKLVINYRIIFKKPLCNLIILGDLVDGSRDSGIDYLKEVTDPYGIFEYLLHIILYNLRISGNKIGSRIDIVMGNHEIMTLFNYDEKNDDDEDINNYYNFVHLSARNVYGTQDMRSKVLCLFYMLQPSIFLQVINNNKIIALMLHGSFSTSNDILVGVSKENLDKIDDKIMHYFLQAYRPNNLDDKYYAPGIPKKKDWNNDLQKIVDDADNKSLLLNFITMLTNSRLFAEDLAEINNGDECKKVINSTIKHNEHDDSKDLNMFIVMGHCPMLDYTSNARRRYVIDNNITTCGYKSCANKDCIFVGCVHENIPRLIVVDNGLSEANIIFNDDDTENFRFKEVNFDDGNTQQYYKNITSRKNDFKVFVELLLLKYPSDSNRRQRNEYDFYRIRTNFESTPNDVVYYKINTKNNTTYPSCDMRIKKSYSCPPSEGYANKGGDYNAYRKHKQAYISLCIAEKIL
jgi:hypothetical protein